MSAVYIQTRQNGHNGTGKVMKACRTHGVRWAMVSTGMKPMLVKAQEMRDRYRETS